MIKNLLSFFLLLFVVAGVEAQTTILDFETPGTSTTFQYFGSSQDGTLTQVVANPDATGENTSSMVTLYVKPAVAEVWAGAFSNPNPSIPVDLTSHNKVAIKVWMDHIGNLALKLENSTNGGSNWITTVANTKVNEWETLIFDVTAPSIEAPNNPAAGFVYATVTLFVDFGTGGTGTDVTTYLDDIVTLPSQPAATTILDFETPATYTTFQYFGSSLDGTLTQVVPNPDASGENTSSMVTQFVKPAVAEVWAGAFSNPNPSTPVDLTSHNKVAIKVWMDHIGNLTLKLENSTNGGANWITTVANTKVNEWETLIFDVTQPSIESPNTPAAGYIYSTITLFFDFGTGGSGTDVISYFDDIVTLPAGPNITTVLDFEAPETSTGFQYFGSALDGTFTQVIPNPNPTGINTSANVTQYIKPAVAEVWAGAFSNPNPTTPVTLDVGSQVCIKVHMDHIGNLALKLEQGATGQPNWITTVSNTLVNEWEELCFDISAPSIESPFEAASGTYARITLFFDFGSPGTGVDVTSYFDDIVVKSTSAPETHVIHFSVDMNQYSENFDSVFVSGTFNNWSGNANPLSDPEFDGIWEGDVEALNGTYEYKVTLDNWAAQENFTGYEECTRSDPSGQFVNRLLLVSGDASVPTFCFNSCYACGQQVEVTFRIGMGMVTPNPAGVWLAGGGNFDVPGGKYRMQDNDADGVYEITVPRYIGFSSFYTFANGPCGDYSCKENIEGQDCAHPENFNDRFLDPLTTDLTIESCFAICSDNVECTVGTKDLQKDETIFELLGNPSADVSFLYFNRDNRDERIISVTNSLGMVIRQWRVSGDTVTESLDTGDLAAGLYWITVYTGNRFYTRKLVH